MRNLYCRTIPFCALLLAATAQGADRFDPMARAAAVAPYLDDQAIAVVHVDPTRVDLAAGTATIAELTRATPADKAEMAVAAKRGEALIAAFAKAGGRDLYVVVSLADVPRGPPFLIATLKDGGDHRAIVRLLLTGQAGEVDGPPSGVETAEQIGNDVFAGSKAALARLKALRAAPRPELAKAFEAAGDTAAQILIMPTEDNRRVIRETLPTLPPEIGGGSGKVVIDGFQWGAIGLNTPPKLSVQLRIQSKDAESAKELAKVIGASFALLGNEPEMRKVVPKFDELVKLMTPTVKDNRLTLVINQENGGAARLTTALTVPVNVARQMQSSNNLKQFALAMHNYHDTYGKLPATSSYSKDGKPLLSWRVHVLPFLEQNELHKQFHLDEPWDSEHNKKLIEKMPKVFSSPLVELKEPGKTPYLVPVAAGTAFGSKEGLSFTKILDGTSNTIMLVEAPAGKAVIWTKPEDLKLDLDKPVYGDLMSPTLLGFLTAFCDGSVQLISDKIDPPSLKALLTVGGGETVDRSKF